MIRISNVPARPGVPPVSGPRLPTVLVVEKREQDERCAVRAQKAPPLSAPLTRLLSLSPLVALASDADCSDQTVPREVRKNPPPLQTPKKICCDLTQTAGRRDDLRKMCKSSASLAGI